MSLMKLSEISGTPYQGGRQASSAPTLDMGGFSALLDEMKKASETSAAETVKHAVDRAQDGEELRWVYEHLSAPARDVVDRVNAGAKDITKDEWTGLCRELKDAGVITQSDFDYTRADIRLIPIGYTSRSGTFVKYPAAPSLLAKLRTQAANFSSGGKNACLSCDSYDWAGDPLAYLDAWITMLYGWRSDMAETGSAGRFPDFSPIDSQISSCQKVCHLIGELGRF